MAAKFRNYCMELMSICVQLGWYGGRTMPVLLVDVPGEGKTQGVEVMGAILGKEAIRRKLTKKFHVATTTLPQTAPEDIAGIPAHNKELNCLERMPLKDIRDLIDAAYGIWFGDEASSCPQQVGAATMTLVQDGRAGDATLPNTVGRIIAANPVWCAAAGRDWAAPEINRVCEIQWELPLADWLDFERGGPGMGAHVRFLEPDWEQRFRPVAATIVTAFVAENAALSNTMKGHQPTTTEANCHKPWASKRQWSNVIRLLAACLSLGEEPSSKLCMMALEGCLGEGVAKAFMAYLREFDLAEPEDVLAAAMREGATPESIRASIPNHIWARPDKLRLQLDSVAIAAQQEREDRPARWTGAMRVLEPVLEEKPDNAMSAAKLLTDRKPPGVAVPDVAIKLFKAREKSGLSRGSGQRK